MSRSITGIPIASLLLAAASYGQLSYLPAVAINTGPNATAIAAADFDADGDLDLAVANRGGSAAADDGTVVILSNTLGLFTAGPALNADKIVRPIAIVVADFDGTNGADLAVVLNGEDAVLVLLNDGSGGFSSAGKFEVGNAPEAIAVGDFDGIGGPDIAVSNTDADSVSVLLNQGGGAFADASAIDFLVLAQRTRPRGIVAADVDGNSTVDLAVVLSDRDEVAVRLGNGDGSFNAAFVRIAVAVSVGEDRDGDPSGLLGVDIDGDDDIDLISGNTVGDSVTVLLNDGAGGFTDAGDFEAGNDPRGMAAGDINGDGLLDLAVANGEGDRVSVLAGKGDGAFDAAESFMVGSGPTGVAIGDFDGNGKIDLASANQESNNVSVRLEGELIVDGDVDACPLAGGLSLAVPTLALLGARRGRRPTR